MFPITTKNEAAPQELLKTISCKCTKGCKAACTCRKAGLRCSVICSGCQGQSCTNVEIYVDDLDQAEETEDKVLAFLEHDKHEEAESDKDDADDNETDTRSFIEARDPFGPSTSKKSKLM